MRYVLLAALLFSAGCASTQVKTVANEWQVTHLDGYSLQADTTLEKLHVDTVAGNFHVFIFERTVGRIEVDAGYMERIWLQTEHKNNTIAIPEVGQAYYEQLCRCQYAGFHEVIEGNLKLKFNGNNAQINGYLQLKERRIDW